MSPAFGDVGDHTARLSSLLKAGLKTLIGCPMSPAVGDMGDHEPSPALSLNQMPRGLVRVQQTGNFHFLTFSCHHRLGLRSDARARASSRQRAAQRFAGANHPGTQTLNLGPSR